jgi:hypothetical protein
MITIKEGELTFNFDENHWSFAKKYDELQEYLNMNKALDFGLTSSKEDEKLKIKNSGIDILALDINKKLYLIEIKDPRKDDSGNVGRKWDVEVAKKIKDTLSGIVGFSNTSNDFKEDFTDSLLCLINNNFTIIFWLESNRITEKEISYKVVKDRNKVVKNRNITNFAFLQKDLLKRLKWLTTSISITNAVTYLRYFEGLKVEDNLRKGINK